MSRAPGSYRPSLDQVIDAYLQGYYPMASGPNGRIGFYYMEPRGVIPLDERFTVRKSLRQIINRQEHLIRFDTAFEHVIRSCARHQQVASNEVWLSHDMIEMYLELHKAGIAHSVEVWSNDATPALCGGLYGLAMGSAFLGESMFSHAPYASQIALVALVDHLRKQGFTLLDAQMSSEHLKQFGLIECTQADYMTMFRQALIIDATF